LTYRRSVLLSVISTAVSFTSWRSLRTVLKERLKVKNELNRLVEAEGEEIPLTAFPIAGNTSPS
jgi:hypothetical protein